MFAAARSPAGASGGGDEAPGGWIGKLTPEHVEVGRVLRESRLPDADPPSKLVERLVGAGPGTAEALVDVLAKSRVPETDADDAPQLLSELQRDLVTAALARCRPSTVRASVQACLSAAPEDTQTRLAAIRAFGAVGGGADIAAMVELAPRRDDPSKALLSDARRALGSACASILQRERGAFDALSKVLRRTDAQAARALLDAVGSTRSPHALAVLNEATISQPTLGPQIAALATVCGASTDRELDSDFVAWLASSLTSARPEYARSLLQAMGVLDDGTHVPAIIKRLEDPDAGVRDSALWALRRISGLGFGDVGTWQAWHHAEVTWLQREKPRLRTDLRCSDPKRIIAALRAYSAHRERRAELASDVARVLDDPRPEIRRLACDVLQYLGSPTVCEPLTESLRDRDRTVSEAAWNALKSITGLDLPRDAELVREILGSA